MTFCVFADFIVIFRNIEIFGMSTTSSMSLFDFTPVSTSSNNHSMSSESIGDVNHNDLQKVVRRLSFTDEPQSPESQSSSRQSLSYDENSQKSDTLSGKTSMRRHSCQLRLLKVGNVCQSSRKSRQPVLVTDPLTKQRKIRVIDYSLWQWQPNIQLNRLTDDELKNVDRSPLQPDPSVQNYISPIKFDKDEEVIREMSPDTAIKLFEEVSVHSQVYVDLILMFLFGFSLSTANGRNQKAKG